MYGIINICAKVLFTEKYGEATWDKIRESAGVDDKFVNYDMYDDETTYKIVHAASQLLGCSVDEVWELFGVFWVIWCMRNGYDALFRTLGGTLSEFLANLDFLHSVYMKTMYPKIIVPSFRVEEKDESNIILHYYSSRRKLGGIVLGIVKGVSRIIFNTAICMHIIDHHEVILLDKKKDHYRFFIRISENGLPSIGLNGNITDQEWKTVINGRTGSHTRHGSIGSYCPVKINTRSHLPSYDLALPCQPRIIQSFQPNLPDKNLLDGSTFCMAFPYHVVFNSDLVIMHAGIKLQQLCPLARREGTRLNEIIQLNHPDIELTATNIRLFINMIFMVTLKQLNRKKLCLSLRGQMMEMKTSGLFIFLSSPVLTSLTELRTKNMHFSDIAPHDITRDLILFNQQRIAEVGLAKELEQKKEELRTLMRDLEMEKKKTDSLLFSMLPKEVANDLREGRHVQAGEFPEVTVMFSDIVKFTDMCSRCQPIQVIHFLNDMYSMFDKLTTVHGVYKVETIGDAYMVVGGLPVPSSTHAERTVSFGLDTLDVIPQLKSPVPDHQVQVRIGAHTGPVVAGVVGLKMPRYCLFGDTVNTASRMESHGTPGKIHASYSVVKAICNDDRFHAEIRGDVFIKGKGNMDTYFLMRSSTTPKTASVTSLSNEKHCTVTSPTCDQPASVTSSAFNMLKEGQMENGGDHRTGYQSSSDRLEVSVLSSSAHISNIKVSSNFCSLL